MTRIYYDDESCSTEKVTPQTPSPTYVDPCKFYSCNGELVAPASAEQESDATLYIVIGVIGVLCICLCCLFIACYLMNKKKNRRTIFRKKLPQHINNYYYKIKKKKQLDEFFMYFLSSYFLHEYISCVTVLDSNKTI